MGVCTVEKGTVVLLAFVASFRVTRVKLQSYGRLVRYLKLYEELKM